VSYVGDPVQRFTSGAEIGVDVAAIERELAALWRQAGEKTQGVVRACLWNLIVRTDGDDLFERAKRLIGAIAPACPARVLMLRSGTPGTGHELEAWISANCHVAPGGGKLMCSEEVTIATRGRGDEHVPSLVRALLVPDVPTALYWAGPPPRDLTEARQLVEMSDRLIVDSGAAGAIVEQVHLVKVRDAARRVRVSDLGWLRLAGTRVLLASFFDAPVGTDPLERLRTVRVVGARGGTATALLLLGWLMSRLGLGTARTTSAHEGRAWLLACKSGEVRVEFVARDVETLGHGILEVVLEAEGGDRFAVTAHGRESVELACNRLPTRTLAAIDRPDSELLVAALGGRGNDPLFAQALARAVELLA
jgi:glucose-6-phosphate dehydrogenase assembly protein OpcA